jgi:hypothetical protein
MELAQHLTGNTGAFPELRTGPNAHVMHGIQDSPLYWFQTVPYIRERPRHDHAHGVGQV